MPVMIPNTELVFYLFPLFCAVKTDKPRRSLVPEEENRYFICSGLFVTGFQRCAPPTPTTPRNSSWSFQLEDSSWGFISRFSSLHVLSASQLSPVHLGVRVSSYPTRDGSPVRHSYHAYVYALLRTCRVYTVKKETSIWHSFTRDGVVDLLTRARR